MESKENASTSFVAICDDVLTVLYDEWVKTGVRNFISLSEISKITKEQYSPEKLRDACDFLEKCEYLIIEPFNKITPRGLIKVEDIKKTSGITTESSKCLADLEKRIIALEATAINREDYNEMKQQLGNLVNSVTDIIKATEDQNNNIYDRVEEVAKMVLNIKE